MTAETTTTAIAKRTNGPAAQVEAYRDEYAALMPSHVNPDQWVRMAVGAIRGDSKLTQAATNDPGEFLRELRTAARLGLEPGTEQFYLTPRRSKKHNGKEIIRGIVGYQGIVELIYRAGAASSVIVEVVRANDSFRYVPGRDERPIHEIDWFGEDRGDLVGVYAYAVMKDGATSKVVVLNRSQVMLAKAKSDGRNSQYSPWNTDEEPMWLKTAARRLAKWVPTSSEFRKEQLRAVQEVAAEQRDSAQEMPEPGLVRDMEPGQGQGFDPETGEVIVDAEVVDEGARAADEEWMAGGAS